MQIVIVSVTMIVMIRLIVITLLAVVLVGNDKVNRRGFFGKIRDAYIEGRLSANEKRIENRVKKEKLRRRRVFERNVKTLVNGMSKRLKHRRSTVSIVVIGSIVLVVWLCHKGSVGCDSNKDNVR